MAYCRTDPLTERVPVWREDKEDVTLKAEAPWPEIDPNEISL